MSGQRKSLESRKKPSQQRSEHTVNAIFEATIQVLLALGPEKLTTTKVADRAGVSVGTLYQYFGNKQSLLSAVLEKHLNEINTAICQACNEYEGKPLEIMCHGLIDAFFHAKFEDEAASKALYSISSDLEGNEKVANLMASAHASIAQMVATASDAKFEDPNTVTFMVATAMLGPAQTLLTLGADEELQNRTRTELKTMVLSYLKESRKKK